VNPALQAIVAAEVSNGAQIERVADSGNAVIVAKPIKRPSFMANMTLTVCTCGLWLFVWIPLAVISRPMERKLIGIEPNGRIVTEKVK
jgi:hypothetical protein